MSRQLLAHVFASLNALEKTHLDVQSIVSGNEKSPRSEHSQELKDQARLIAHMKRTANRLQLDIAKNDWASAIRSLNIYYGLNSMVRPSVMGIYAALSNIKNPFEKFEQAATVH